MYLGKHYYKNYCDDLKPKSMDLIKWFDGTPTDRKLIHLSDMTGWHFYATDKDMRYAHFKMQDRPEHEFEQDEQYIEKLKSCTNLN